MKLFLDTEFNDFGGKLISLALVPEDDKLDSFYRELVIDYELSPWVKENVYPNLMAEQCSLYSLQRDLSYYLSKFKEIIIVADWPDDIRYFCEVMITGPGTCINFGNKQIKFEIDRSIDYKSLVPHNALYDAMAIRDSYIKKVSEIQK